MTTIDHTHDPAARSWLDSANEADGDFPIQNLPFGVFRRIGSGQAWRGGVAIGDQVLDREVTVRVIGRIQPAARGRVMGVVNSRHTAWAGISRSSKIATARVQPAEAPRILCGKQEMK